MRWITSSDLAVTTGLGNLTVKGTLIEQPPNLTSNGGGLNASAVTTLPGLLQPGATVDVRFLLGVLASFAAFARGHVSSPPLSNKEQKSFDYLHKRWEVDAFYLSKTGTSGWELGEIRVVAIAELRTWVSSLTKLLDETSIPIAKKYCSAPDYP